MKRGEKPSDGKRGEVHGGVCDRATEKGVEERGGEGRQAPKESLGK